MLIEGPTDVISGQFMGYGARLGLVKSLQPSQENDIWKGLYADCYLLDAPGFPVISKCLITSPHGSTSKTAVYYKPQATTWTPESGESVKDADGDFVIISFLGNGMSFISRYVLSPGDTRIGKLYWNTLTNKGEQPSGPDAKAENAKNTRESTITTDQYVQVSVNQKILDAYTNLGISNISSKQADFVPAAQNVKTKFVGTSAGSPSKNFNPEVPVYRLSDAMTKKEKLKSGDAPKPKTKPDPKTQKVTHYAKGMKIIEQNDGNILLDAHESKAKISISLGKNSNLNIDFGSGNLALEQGKMTVHADKIVLDVNSIEIKGQGGKISLSEGGGLTLSGSSVSIKSPSVNIGTGIGAPVMLFSPPSPGIPSVILKAL